MKCVYLPSHFITRCIWFNTSNMISYNLLWWEMSLAPSSRPHRRYDIIQTRQSKEDSTCSSQRLQAMPGSRGGGNVGHMASRRWRAAATPETRSMWSQFGRSSARVSVCVRMHECIGPEPNHSFSFASDQTTVTRRQAVSMTTAGGEAPRAQNDVCWVLMSISDRRVNVVVSGTIFQKRYLYENIIKK